MTFSVAIKFPALPIWKGTFSELKPIETAPFILGWDASGFIRQDLNANDHSAKAYAHDEYAFITAPPGMSEWANRFGKQYLEYITTRVPNITGKKILDVGGGSAYLSQELTSDKYGASSAVVVDPAVRSDSDNKKIKIIRDYFPSKNVNEDFDLILSCNCLEHVPDPLSFLKSIRAAAYKKNADVILIFPDVEKQFDSGDLNVLLHEHISCFTRATADRLFKTVGFKVNHHQSMEDCHFYHLSIGESDSNSSEADPVLDRGKKFFLDAIEFAKSKIRSELDSGLKVAFHGATNGLNNTLFLAEISGHPNVYVFDGDSSKTGRYLPTSVNSIRSSADPSYKTMDRVYISALTFYSECLDFLVNQQGIDPNKIFPISPHFTPTKNPGQNR